MKQNKVCTNLQQDFTDAEKAQGRSNIGAVAASEVATAISNAIGQLDVSDNVTANQFVTSVSESDGRVSVTRRQPVIADVDGLEDALGRITPQVQSDWTQGDTNLPSFVKNKPDLSVYATNAALEAGLATKQNVISDLQTIRDGAALGATAVQDPNYVHTDNNFSDAEKTKLSGIAAGAEVNVQANWNETNTSSDAYIQNKPQNLVQDANYVHTDNNFTSTLKSKLEGIAAGAEVNVQANWNETNTSSDAYIQNKPQNLVQDANYVHTDNNFTSTLKTKLDGLVGVYTVTYGDTTANLFSTLTTKYNAGTEIILKWSSGTGHVDYAYLSDKTDTQFLFMTQWPFDDGNLGRIWLFTLSSAGAWTSTSEWPAKATEANSVAWTGVTGKPSNIVSDANYVHTDNNFTNTLKSKLENLKGVYMVTYGDTTTGLFDNLMSLVNGGTEVILRWSAGTDKVNYAFLADVIDNVQLMFIATWPYNDGTFGHGEIFTLGRVGGWSHTSRNVASAANAAGDNAGHTIATYYMPRENIRILGFTGAPANMGTTGVSIMEGHLIKVGNGGQVMATISVNNNSAARATLKFYLRYVTRTSTVYGAARSIYVAAGGSSSVCLNIDVADNDVQSLIAMCEWRDAGSASTTNPGISFSTNLLVVGDNITVN